MKRYDGISLRSYASFREEARLALRRKWKPALLVFLVIMLMSGVIIGANCSYSTSTENPLFWELEASIGPFSTRSMWRNGKLFWDSATAADSPFVLPYSPLFVAAAALTALLLLIIQPISVLAQTRMMVNLLDGITPDFSVLHTTARKYWLCVRTELLIFWQLFWPMMLGVICSAALAAFFPDSFIIPFLPALAGFVLLIIRAFGYVAAIYLIVTHPDMTARKALSTSKQMMKGRKWRYALLSLTFIGWEMLFCAFAAALITVRIAFAILPFLPITLPKSLGATLSVNTMLLPFSS